MTVARWYAKANAIAPAMPSSKIASIALLLAIAEHETRCGDAWAGEHNWGATTRRGLSPADREALDGVAPIISPTSARLASELAATDALADAGIAPTDAAIHVDSRPPGIVYFTWFAKFSDDAAGAAYFVTFFRTMAEKQGLADGNAWEEASAMYAAHYYTGVHIDAAEDITDYFRAISPLQSSIVAALVNWTPGAEPPPPEVGSVIWVQERLNALGITTPPLVEDGLAGPKTSAAIKAFQISNGLAVTGAIDSETVNALMS